MADAPATAADALGAAASTPPPIGNPAAVTAGTATAGGTVFSGLQAPSGNMPADAPANFNDIKVNVSPGNTPDPGRLHDLLSLITAIGTGYKLDGYNPQVIADVGKNAGLSPQAIAALRNGSATDKNKAAALKAAWTGINAQLVNLGVPAGALQRAGMGTAPTVANAKNKATQVANIPLESSTLHYFSSQGVDTTGMKNIDTLINSHAEGKLTGTVDETPATLASQYDQFVTDWNNNQNNFRLNTTQDLVGMGALDISGGNPSADQVAQAWQSVAQYAANNHTTIPTAMTQLKAHEPQGQVTLPGGGTKNINQ